MLQSFIYLKLSVAGHLFLFAARTRSHFWSIRPGIPLFLAVADTQITATLITVYGILLPAISWQLAIFVWIYSSIEFVIVDFSKIIKELIHLLLTKNNQGINKWNVALSLRKISALK